MKVEVDAGLEENPQGDLSVEVPFEQRPESFFSFLESTKYQHFVHQGGHQQKSFSSVLSINDAFLCESACLCSLLPL